MNEILKLNIGIAGSDKGNYGDLYLVDKISTYQRKKMVLNKGDRIITLSN